MIENLGFGRGDFLAQNVGILSSPFKKISNYDFSEGGGTLKVLFNALE